jgi:hypothetical protein
MALVQQLVLHKENNIDGRKNGDVSRVMASRLEAACTGRPSEVCGSTVADRQQSCLPKRVLHACRQGAFPGTVRCGHRAEGRMAAPIAEASPAGRFVDHSDAKRPPTP